MKGKIKGKHIVILVISIFFLSVIVTSNVQRYKKEREMLGGLKIPSSAVYIDEKDTHGGMGNDGEYFSKIQISEEDKEKFLENAISKGTWCKMPLPENLFFIKHGNTENEKYIGMIDESLKTPENIEGIYFYKDRFAEWYPEEYQKKLAEMGNKYYSSNYTLSILDIKNSIIYISLILKYI